MPDAESVPATPTATEPAPAPAPAAREYYDDDEFSYRPTPVWLPLAGVATVLGLLGFVNLLALGFTVLGLLFSGIALWLIRRNPDLYSGGTVATVALAVSVVSLLGGVATHAYLYINELPEGHLRVHFGSDISRKGFVFDQENGARFHEDVAALDGQRIFIKGFMYPDKDTQNLPTFLLVKDSGDCCFGGDPAATDMITVLMEEGRRVDFTNRKVQIAGVLRLKDPNQRGSLQPVMVLEDAWNFAPAKSQF